MDFQNVMGSNFIHNSGPFSLSQYIDHHEEDEFTNDDNFNYGSFHHQDNTNTKNTNTTNHATHTLIKTTPWRKS